MTSIIERCQNVWKHISQGQTVLPSMITIPLDHVDTKEKVGLPVLKDESYFQIRINEMYLAHDRQWFSRYAPMVFAISEFLYDKREEAVPFVAGSAMMEQYKQEMPMNMIFTNTRVAGLHPYRGGRLSLSVILYQVRREDYISDLLRVVENITNVLNGSLPLSNYVKVAHVALDSIETVMGLQDTAPLIGWRKEFDPDGGDAIQSGYFALIDSSQTHMDGSSFWVRDQQLYYGRNLMQAVPYRDANFILHSIMQSSERSDLRTLPFYPLYEQILTDANEPYDAIWKRTKANMTTLAQQLILSPDLAPAHADKLIDQYAAEMQKKHKMAVARGMLGPAKKMSNMEQRLNRSIKILSM